MRLLKLLKYYATHKAGILAVLSGCIVCIVCTALFYGTKARQEATPPAEAARETGRTVGAAAPVPETQAPADIGGLAPCSPGASATPSAYSPAGASVQPPSRQAASPTSPATSSAGHTARPAHPSADPPSRLPRGTASGPLPQAAQCNGPCNDFTRQPEPTLDDDSDCLQHSSEIYGDFDSSSESLPGAARHTDGPCDSLASIIHSRYSEMVRNRAATQATTQSASQTDDSSTGSEPPEALTLADLLAAIQEEARGTDRQSFSENTEAIRTLLHRLYAVDDFDDFESIDGFSIPRFVFHALLRAIDPAFRLAPIIPTVDDYLFVCEDRPSDYTLDDSEGAVPFFLLLYASGVRELVIPALRFNFRPHDLLLRLIGACRIRALSVSSCHLEALSGLLLSSEADGTLRQKLVWPSLRHLTVVSDPRGTRWTDMLRFFGDGGSRPNKGISRLFEPSGSSLSVVVDAPGFGSKPLWYLPRITNLYLHSTQNHFPAKGCLDNFKEVELLFLRADAFSARALPDHFMRSLPRGLRALSMTGVVLDSVPEEIGQLSQLRGLLLENNKNLSRLPATMTQLANLRIFILKNNRMHPQDADGLMGLNSLSQHLGDRLQYQCPGPADRDASPQPCKYKRESMGSFCRPAYAPPGHEVAVY